MPDKSAMHVSLPVKRWARCGQPNYSGHVDIWGYSTPYAGIMAMGHYRIPILMYWSLMLFMLFEIFARRWSSLLGMMVAMDIPITSPSAALLQKLFVMRVIPNGIQI